MTRTEAKYRLMEYGLTDGDSEALIAQAEADNCEPTSRLQPDWDTTVEFKGSAVYRNSGVEVFYYQEQKDIEYVAEHFSGDLSYLTWIPARYETW